MAVRVFEKILKYKVLAACTQPLRIGSAMGAKEEVLVHPVDDVPFIQASSIAGACRDYCAKKYGQADTQELFGSNEAEWGSRICFTDGKFASDSVILELRPRVSIDPATGTCSASVVKGTTQQAGHKFNMEYIGAGAEFSFCIYLYDDGKQEMVKNLLSAIHQGQIQFGGQKSNGCGCLQLKKLWIKEFIMTEEQGRRQWAMEDEAMQEDGMALQALEKLPVNKSEAYDVCVTGCTEGCMLVKSIAVPEFGKDAPDCMNIQNAAKDYIVPGSSFKGAIRSQMEKIASYLGCQEIIQNTFGYTGVSGQDGKAGNLVVYDTIVGDRKEYTAHRIHIDKFTGGVMDGGLFHEKNIAGRLEFHISIKNKNEPERSLGLLLLALRDLSIGVMGIGGGYNVGKGIIHVEKMAVSDHIHSKEAEICFWEKCGITKGQELVQECIRAVHAKEDAK